jgi:hypothetical protein
MIDWVRVVSEIHNHYERVQWYLPEWTKYIDINWNEWIIIKPNYIERAWEYDEKVVFIDCLVNWEIITYCNDTEVSSDSYDCDWTEKFYNICMKILD